MLASLTLIRLNNVNKGPCMYSNHKEHPKLGPHVVQPSDLSFFFISGFAYIPHAEEGVTTGIQKPFEMLYRKLF